MLDEIRTFVVLAEAGSLQRAAARLFLTPSAVTRQVQRLEATLQTPLLDRRVKPARITRAGRAVLDAGRQVLRAVEDLKVTASNDAEPRGVLRLGLAHALGQPALVASIQQLTSRFERVRPVLSTDLTQRLIEQVRAGDLDLALALIPVDGASPSGVACAVLATERLVLVRARGSAASRRAKGARSARGKPEQAVAHALDMPWVLNPTGCLVRQALEVKLREMGAPFRVAAEIHNIELQVALVAAGMGIGIVPARFLATHAKRQQLERLNGMGVGLGASIVLLRASHLGQLDVAATFLEDAFRAHFATRS